MTNGTTWRAFHAAALSMIADLPGLPIAAVLRRHSALQSFATLVHYEAGVIGDIDREVNMPVLLKQVQHHVFQREFAHAFDTPPPLHLPTEQETEPT